MFISSSLVVVFLGGVRFLEPWLGRSGRFPWDIPEGYSLLIRVLKKCFIGGHHFAIWSSVRALRSPTLKLQRNLKRLRHT